MKEKKSQEPECTVDYIADLMWDAFVRGCYMPICDPDELKAWAGGPAGMKVKVSIQQNLDELCNDPCKRKEAEACAFQTGIYASQFTVKSNKDCIGKAEYQRAFNLVKRNFTSECNGDDDDDEKKQAKGNQNGLKPKRQGLLCTA